jgi:branched-chain amino acid transport system substrate-binding protein
VKELSFDLNEPTVDSQIVTFKASGADTFYDVAYPKFAVQAIRKSSELGWKPLTSSRSSPSRFRRFSNRPGWTNPSASFRRVMPRIRQTHDGRMTHTPDFLAWLQKYYPGADPNDIFVANGYNFAQPLLILLAQCGDELSRENIMRQATNLHDASLPWLPPLLHDISDGLKAKPSGRSKPFGVRDIAASHAVKLFRAQKRTL